MVIVDGLEWDDYGGGIPYFHRPSTMGLSPSWKSGMPHCLSNFLEEGLDFYDNCVARKVGELAGNMDASSLS